MMEYDRVMPSRESQRSGIAYARIPRTGEPQSEPQQVHYERPIYGGSLKGAFRIPRSAIKALGNGDIEAGYKVAGDLFGHHGALGRGTVHPMMLNILGSGDPKAGRRVLQKFIDRVTREGSQ